VRHSLCCTLFLINCFEHEMVLCHLYLKRFDLTKGLLFDAFSITVWYKLCRYDHSIIKLESFFTTNELIYRTRNFKLNASRFKLQQLMTKGLELFTHTLVLQCSSSTSLRKPKTTHVFADSGIRLLCHALRICVAHAPPEFCPFSLLVH